CGPPPAACSPPCSSAPPPASTPPGGPPACPPPTPSPHHNRPAAPRRLWPLPAPERPRWRDPIRARNRGAFGSGRPTSGSARRGGELLRPGGILHGAGQGDHRGDQRLRQHLVLIQLF